jgi:hypothetical protein
MKTWWLLPALLSSNIAFADNVETSKVVWAWTCGRTGYYRLTVLPDRKYTTTAGRDYGGPFIIKLLRELTPSSYCFLIILYQFNNAMAHFQQSPFSKILVLN